MSVRESTADRADECLGEDELLVLAAGSLADSPASEAHLASCATCAALLASVVREGRTHAWGSLAGSTLGPYRIDAQIGAGGMGAVYRGWDPRLGRAIAVKVLHGEGDRQDERLAAEARAAASIDHRTIVGIFDVGCADGLHYVAMELVDGESLRSVIDRGSLNATRASELALELLGGLAAAHGRGVVHRDLKPENLLLTRDGLRVLDFGLASSADGGALERTDPAAIHGTPGYMAPEQARGEPADARADLFAVGAILYELVTGRRAFPGATPAERVSATLRDTPPLDKLGPLAPIVARCLAKAPADRFQSAADLAWSLRVVATGPAIEPVQAVPPRGLSRRAVLAGGAAAGLTAAAAGALGFVLGRRGARPSALPGMQPLTHRTGRIYTARFTHDGARVVYGAAWDAEPVGVHVVELLSGETTVLDLGHADVLAVSAYGELAISEGHRFVDHQSVRGHLAIVPLAGGLPRALADDVQEADFLPRTRTTVGHALAVVRPAGQRFRIELPIGTPLLEEDGWITHLRVSPDGERLAYARHPQVNDDAGEIIIVDLATRARRVLSKGWVSVAGLAWDPSGEALYFTASAESLVNTLHRVTLAGAVTDLRTPAADRMLVHDIAPDRRVLASTSVWRLRAIAGGRDRSLSNISYVSDLSADGEQLLVGELGNLEAGRGAYLLPYAGGKRLRLGSGYPLAISPLASRVAANVETADHLVVYQTGSGETPSIETPGWAIVGRWIDERDLVILFDKRLWRVGIGRSPAPLTPTGGVFALDPARRRCAYIDDARVLHVLDLLSGATREIARDIVHDDVCGWVATPDAIAVRSHATPITVNLIDVATGARTRHLEVAPPPIGLKAVDTFLLHADGKRYAYSYGEELSQLFLMERPA